MNASCARSPRGQGTSVWASRTASPPPPPGGTGRRLAPRVPQGARPAQTQTPRPLDGATIGGVDPTHPVAPRAATGGHGRPPVKPPLRPQIRRDYPLSLSISISGGKETYKDSPSNGERTGKSPALESGGLAVRIVVWRSVLRDGPGPSPLEGGAGEGESPVVPGPCRSTRRCRRVGLFGNAAQSGR